MAAEVERVDIDVVRRIGKAADTRANRLDRDSRLIRDQCLACWPGRVVIYNLAPVSSQVPAGAVVLPSGHVVDCEEGLRDSGNCGDEFGAENHIRTAVPGLMNFSSDYVVPAL